MPQALNLDALLQSVRLSICVTDPNEVDNPIIYVNPAFLDLTGYEKREVLGQNCRFLQGRNTKKESIAAVRKMVEGKRLSSVDIVNYRKDGSEFINSLQIGPVFDQESERMLMFGSQIDVTTQRAEEAEIARAADAEIVHRLKNMTSVMSSIMRTTAQGSTDIGEFVELSIGRLHALSSAHVATINSDDQASASAVELCSSIVKNYAPDPGQLIIEGKGILVARDARTPLSLALHELATNSVKYGALSCKPGKVNIVWEAVDGGEIVEMIWHERNGPEVIQSGRTGGSQLIARLLERIGASIEYNWHPQGLIAKITMPV